MGVEGLRRARAALLCTIFALALSSCDPAYATELRIPALAGGTASVKLVYKAEQSRQVLGFDGPEWATAYSRLDLAADALIELTPTASIATPGGLATCYLVSVTAPGGRGGAYCVQMPDAAETQELASLVDAAPIDPADLAEVRLIPPAAAPSASLRIPPLASGQASIQLVAQATQKPVLGFDGPEWATAYEALDLSSAQIVPLTPTAAIATAGGGPTCYLVSVTAPGGRGGSYCVQVPELPSVYELAALIGASGIDPGEILVEADPLWTASPSAGVTADDLAHWSAAYGWGDHALAGYLLGETDPVFAASPAAGVTADSLLSADERAALEGGDVYTTPSEENYLVKHYDQDIRFMWTVGWDTTPVQVLAAASVITYPLDGGTAITGAVCTVVGAADGSPIEIDILAAGVSLLDTTITIDSGELSSITAEVPAVVADGAELGYGDIITTNVVAIGAIEPGAGLKCWLEGRPL